MAEHSLIEWTDATWNPVTGCRVVSPGCTNCYAMKLAGGRLQHHPTRQGLTQDTKAGPVWTGEVRFNEAMLLDPLRWSRPRKIFVCAHGDLFAEGVPDEWIDKVFAVMALCPQHVFQVLTKRPARMREYLTRRAGGGKQDVLNHLAWVVVPAVAHLWCADWVREPPAGAHRSRVIKACAVWPLPNVWLGVSAEDQPRADERIPELLASPAAKRFVSLEPLLGAIHHLPAPGLDWVIVGGESGTGARPMHPDWVRDLMRQCAEADVPFFFKQWGNWRVVGEVEGLLITADRIYRDASGTYAGRGGFHQAMRLERVSKAAAGRLLDGVEHNGMPA